MTGRVRSEASRSGQALCWPGLAGLPCQGLNSAVALVSGGSELLAHDELGVLPYIGMHSLRPRKGAESPRQDQALHDLYNLLGCIRVQNVLPKESQSSLFPNDKQNGMPMLNSLLAYWTH